MNALNLGSSGALSSYQLVETSNSGTSPDVFLNVFQLAPVSVTSSPRTASLVQDTANQMQGAQVGEWLVLMGRTERVAGTVEYALGASATKHLVTDLVPNAEYTVTAMDAQGAAVYSGTVVASPDGSARFNVSVTSARRYRLTPTGRILPVTPGNAWLR